MSKDGRNIGIRMRERKRVRGEGRELVTDTEGYLDGKEGMSEMFLAISQVFPVRERPCPTRTSLFMTSGIRVNAKVDAEEGKKPLFPNIPFSEPLHPTPIPIFLLSRAVIDCTRSRIVIARCVHTG